MSLILKLGNLRKNAFLKSLATIVATFVLLLSFAVEKARLDRVGPLVALFMLLAVTQNHQLITKAWKSLLTPFLPFVIGLLLLSPFQSTAATSYLMAALAGLYVFARGLKAFLPLDIFLVSISIFGLFSGLISVLHHYSTVASPIILDLYVLLGEKNPTGWASALGFVALSILVLRRQPVATVWTLVSALLASFVLLLYSDSVTSVLAGLSGATAVISIRVFSARREKEDREKLLWPAMFLIFPAVGGIALLSANFSSFNWPESLPISRDFSTATGRTAIWRCYLDSLESSVRGSWESTLSCLSPFEPAHLHSSFFESNLLGGPVLVALLVFGLMWSLARGILDSQRPEVPSVPFSGLVALGFTLTTLIIMLSESAMYYPAALTTLILFFAVPGFSGEKAAVVSE